MFSQFCQSIVFVHSSREGQSSKQRIKVLPFTGEFGTSAFYHNFLTGHKCDHHTVAGPVAHSTLNECKREESSEGRLQQLCHVQISLRRSMQ